MSPTSRTGYVRVGLLILSAITGSSESRHSIGRSSRISAKTTAFGVQYGVFAIRETSVISLNVRAQLRVEHKRPAHGSWVMNELLLVGDV